MLKARWVTNSSKLPLLLGLFLLIPIQLGAKGCEVGVVGDFEGEAGGSAGAAVEVGGSGQSQAGQTSAGHAGGSKPSTTTSTAKLCGARLGNTCDKGQYCKYEQSAQCGAADQPGVCTTLPEVCMDLYSPVCGCDGTTYGNACTAAAKGISVKSTGECGGVTLPTEKMCGGIAGIKCEDGQYCDYSLESHCGATDQSGTCKPRPKLQVDLYDPVCGCDGKDYSNPNDAAFYGVAVASKGRCATTPTSTICGGIAGLKCGDGQYCDYSLEAQCGAADQSGTCKARPTVQVNSYDPVCGCDGKNYSNPNDAAFFGVAVASKGRCASQPTEIVCGGLQGLQCPTGQYCSYSLEALCGASDQTGLCAPLPAVCPNLDSKVCGCDGKTYSNDCLAAVAGVSVASKGACESVPTDTLCGGIAGRTCPIGQYCNFAVDTKCGSGDQMGTCSVKPEGCIAIYKPVCGCNGRTYPSACDAAADGTSVAATNACPQ